MKKGMEAHVASPDQMAGKGTGRLTITVTVTDDRDRIRITLTPPVGVVPQTPRPPIPLPRVLTLLPNTLTTRQFQKITKRRRKDSRHLPGIQLGNERDLGIGILPRLRIIRVQQRDAGPHHQLGFGKIGRQFAEVLDAEGPRERVVRVRQADLFPCFAARGLEGGFGQGVCSAW